MPLGLHPDTQKLVADFCTALAEKLYKAQLKYGYDTDWKQDGWPSQCQAHFHQHIAKGDPRDVAAYCAFMWWHGWSTKPAEGLESRTVTVKLPPELYTIGELIRTQDNRITDQPMFVVFQKREIIGSDEHSPSRICWVWDGEEVTELRAKRLEALYQDGRDTRGYDRYAMQELMSLLLPALPSMDAKTSFARTDTTCASRISTPAALYEITNISWLEIGSLASSGRLSDVDSNYLDVRRLRKPGHHHSGVSNRIRLSSSICRSEKVNNADVSLRGVCTPKGDQ
ncbi:Uncharacterised protein [Klebsiella pneumoniae subsp. pneumoniae]|uniref:Uncharacterized protein n=1 Tax=Klebsiella pneumoniae subsp. pneumoniae TaxID=72407 RepID=A0A377ZEY4_KLEPN|nr:Uncharacterised protein [Klebsiella pneumoniae subsp. pneumoniae]